MPKQGLVDYSISSDEGSDEDSITEKALIKFAKNFWFSFFSCLKYVYKLIMKKNNPKINFPPPPCKPTVEKDDMLLQPPNFFQR